MKKFIKIKKLPNDITQILVKNLRESIHQPYHKAPRKHEMRPRPIQTEGQLSDQIRAVLLTLVVVLVNAFSSTVK